MSSVKCFTFQVFHPSAVEFLSFVQKPLQVFGPSVKCLETNLDACHGVFHPFCIEIPC